MSLNLIIHTDGSSLGNPGPGGWGVLIEEGIKKIKLSGGEPCSTNNRMEMQGMIEAFKWVKKQKKEKYSIALYADSALLINSLNHHWKRKANLDLWQELDAARQNLKVNYHWIKGHAGHEGNEIVNELAIQAAKKFIGLKPAKIASTSTEKYFCQKCKKYTGGKLTLLPNNKLIRVDCEICQSYIKFAKHSKENLIKAKKKSIAQKQTLF